MERRTHKTFRLHLMLTAAIVTATFALVSALLVFVPVFTHLDSDHFDRDVMGGVARYALHLHASFWPVVVGAMIASVASGMVLFERMRSPLRRFAQVYQAVAAGETPDPVRLRAYDYLHGEARDLNDLLEFLRRQRETTRHALEQLEHALAEAESAEAPAKRDAALAQAREAIETLRPVGAREG